MTNSFFNLPSYTLGNYSFKNIFPTYKNLPILSTILNNKQYFYYKTIADDTRLELLSFTEYGESKYWDVLFYINNMEHIFDLPTNGDNLINRVQAKLLNYETKFGAILNSTVRNERYNTYFSELDTNNELHRNFRFVRKEYLPMIIGMINGS
jgi:hypothetical protein